MEITIFILSGLVFVVAIKFWYFDRMAAMLCATVSFVIFIVGLMAIDVL